MRPESEHIQQDGHNTQESTISHPSVNLNPTEPANTVSMGAVTEAFYYDQMQAGQQIVAPVSSFSHFNHQMGGSVFEGQGQQGQHQPLSPETRRLLERLTGLPKENKQKR